MSASAAKLVNNKQYVILPLAAGQNAGMNHFMTAGADGSVSLEAGFSDAAVWQWSFVPGTATVVGHYTLRNVSTGKYLFEESAGAVTLSESDLTVVKGDSPVTDAAVTLAVDGRYLAVTDQGVVTVSADASPATSAFVMMDYVASQTAAEIEEAAANAVAVAFGIPDAISQLKPLLEAGYTGTRQMQRVLNVLYYCETPADISTQIVEVRRTAVRMFESDFENGVLWQQKSSGLYVSVDGNSVVGKECATAESIWYGRFTDNGNSLVEGRKFRLYNNSTKHYLVYANGIFSTSAAQNDGTLWTVAHFYGQGLAIKPADSDDNSRLLYLGADKSLVAGADVDLALTYAGEIAMFGEGVNSVKPVGAPGEKEGTYSSVNAIEVVVEHGAVAAADGTMTLSYSYDDETSVLGVFNTTELKDPVIKTVNVDYYDSTGTHVTGTAEVDVYTLDLGETYTDGGQYMVRINMGAFTLNGAMSKEMAGYCDLEVSNLWEPIVTPAAGTVSALTEITVTGSDGIYPNPKASNTATLDINCDGVTVEMFSRDDFAEGGKFDSYDAADPLKPWFTIPVNYTTPGRYSIHIEQSFFIDNNGNPCADISVVWEIDEEDNIRVVSQTGSGNAAVPTFDLLGRPATKGLIIGKDGKKYVR